MSKIYGNFQTKESTVYILFTYFISNRKNIAPTNIFIFSEEN